MVLDGKGDGEYWLSLVLSVMVELVSIYSASALVWPILNGEISVDVGNLLVIGK